MIKNVKIPHLLVTSRSTLPTQLFESWAMVEYHLLFIQDRMLLITLKGNKLKIAMKFIRTFDSLITLIK